ncbi:MAG: hypothetical protein LQ347_002629 [Umbilicaria vellea]|nr:MAG: hypothetical protein LQ347_002629 [Umbilicaria vellea]
MLKVGRAFAQVVKGAVQMVEVGEMTGTDELTGTEEVAGIEELDRIEEVTCTEEVTGIEELDRIEEVVGIKGPPAEHVSTLANPIWHTAGKTPPSLSISGLAKKSWLKPVPGTLRLGMAAATRSPDKRLPAALREKMLAVLGDRPSILAYEALPKGITTMYGSTGANSGL